MMICYRTVGVLVLSLVGEKGRKPAFLQQQPIISHMFYGAGGVMVRALDHPIVEVARLIVKCLPHVFVLHVLCNDVLVL
jgi:hypothetical protein